MPRIVKKSDTDTIGKRIKEARYQKRMSQDELSKIVGLSAQAHVSHHETGLKKPGEKILKKYAKALDVTIEWLRYGIDPKNIDFENELVEDQISKEELLKEINALKDELSLLKNLVISMVETIKVLVKKVNNPSNTSIN